MPQIAFATVAALRGSLSLVMIADYIIKSDFYTGSPVGRLWSGLVPCAGHAHAWVRAWVRACMHVRKASG